MATVQQAFELAVEHHQAGRLAEAEALYRQILAAQPDHADALHLLGVIAHQVGRHDLAVEMISRAIALNPNNPDAYLNLGGACCAMGRRDEGVLAFRRAILLKPDYADAYNNLGNALREQGDADAAVSACRRALEAKGDFPEAHNNLGNALRDKGHVKEAIAEYRCALQFKPAYPEARNNLGNALKDQGHVEEAIVEYRCALQLRPNYPEAHNDLGHALRDRGQYDEAIAAFRQALQLKPDYVDAQNSLGATLKDKGELDEAIATFRRALQLQPDHVEACSNLGVALAEQGRLDEAIAAHRRALELDHDRPQCHNNFAIALAKCGQFDEAIAAYRHALQLQPDYVDALCNLGAALKDKGELDEAVAALRRALELKPTYAGAHNNLGSTFKDRGELDAALAAFRQSLQLQPEQASVHSNLLFTLHFNPHRDDEALAGERRRWNQRFSEPLKRLIAPHTNDRDPERRLRIGYVSPDFRDHVVGRNLLPLFQHHDRASFEIGCYAGVVRPDELTDEFRKEVQQWHSTVAMPDDTLAETIRRDRVDILVDLTQHMAGSRLPVFARQPAPVQVSFAGYPESTGVEAIEYRISDRYLEAKDESFPGRERSPSVPSNPVANEEDGERSASLPYPDRKERVFLLESFWCYDPCGMELEVNSLPAKESGRVTFGCLNNFCKVNEPVLRLWARVLREFPDSRLVMLSGLGSHRQRTLEFLEREGVEARRVEFVGLRPRKEYLELYHRLDIALDTFPYNGHTTSLDAVWMGVPVVSLAGERPVSRAGLSQLSNLGLPELVTLTEDGFVEIATRLAHDLPRLAELRRTLRARMEASVLMDAPRFARNIEAAYRAMWRRWCAEKTEE